MINDKLEITKLLISELDLPSDEESIKKYHRSWWKNIRDTASNQMRLTEEGYKIFSDKLKIKTYQIDLQKISFTNQILLYLDKFIEGPYFIDNKSIYIFREKTAIELILFEGDLKKFISAKLSSKKRTEDIERASI